VVCLYEQQLPNAIVLLQSPVANLAMDRKNLAKHQEQHVALEARVCSDHLLQCRIGQTMNIPRPML
jgi:hypothetical protein